MTNKPIILEGRELRAVAALNGRSKCNLFVYAKRDPVNPILVDDLNLAAPDQRARVLSLIAVERQEEAGPLLEQLAAAVAAERTKPHTPRLEAPERFPLIEHWDSEVDGAELLDDIREHILRYVVLPVHAAHTLALWVLHTFVTDVMDYTPYILVTSPVRECGKTTLDEILVNLAYRGIMTGGITAAALYRTIDKFQPTMVLDELDARLRGDAGEMLRGVLNTGFQRNGCITICEGENNEPRDYRTFCPKVLSGIGRVWDTVTSRSIPIRLARASRDELANLTKIRGDRIRAISLPYQMRALRWAADNRQHLVAADPPMPPQLGARQCDVWRPLLAIAATCGRNWAELARAGALALYGVAEEEGDYGLLLLQDLKEIFSENRTENLHTTKILQELTRREDRPWPEYSRDKPLSPRGLSKLLGRFQVKPKNVRVAGELAKGYSLSDLAPVFRTYLAPPASAVTAVTVDPSCSPEARQARPVTDVTDGNGIPNDDERLEREAIQAEGAAA